MNTTPFCGGGHPGPACLKDCLMLVIDPRVDRTRMHNLGDILVIAVCCMLCGGESFYDMEDFGLAKEEWFRTFLDLPNGIPSHDTFNRVFAALDPDKFNACFLKWTEGLRTTVDGDIVSLDGKALRRAAGGAGIPFIVNAWSSSNGIVLGQVKVDDKSNEITAVPELLDALLLKGCIVTLDAMGCQRKTAAKIVGAGADYVISLKGNQETLHAEVAAFLEDAAARDPQELDRFETVEKGHGRIETRVCSQSGRLGWFADLDQWQGLKSVFMVDSVRKIKGASTSERRFFISSLPVDARKALGASRSHWNVENQLHWRLDVQFNEDQCRARTKNAAENLAILRRIALNMLNGEKTKKRGVKGKQKNASWNHDYLMKLLRSDAGPACRSPKTN